MNIEFINYTGEYPNYCRGILILKIDGKLTRFGYGNCCDYEPFWEVGGAWTNEGYGDRTKWIADPYINELPFDVDKLLDIMNQYVTPSCCGGCE